MSEETDRYYAEGYESGAQDLHKWMRRAERAEARVAVLEDYFDNDENSDAWRALNARIRTLEASLHTIRAWDVHNLGDAPWLKSLVDAALTPTATEGEKHD